MTTKYVISSIIPNSTINEDFLDTLKKYASYNGATLKLAETAPNFVTDTKMEEYIEKLDAVKEYLISEGETISDKLVISPIPQNVNVFDPLTGLNKIVAKVGNIIVPFPRHRMQMVARVLKDHKAPRAMWCTGTISDSYYKSTKSGIIAAQYHTYGALVIEVNEDKTFLIRQLTWDGVGFYDLDKYYTPKNVKKGIRIDSITLGDDHAMFLDESAVKQSLELIKNLKPKNVIHHDTYDCCAVSHHLEGKFITKGNLNLTIEQEGLITSTYLDRVTKVSPKDTKHYITAANHPEHLDKYLDEGRYLKDTANHKTALELALAKANGKNVVEVLLKKYSKLDKVIFCTRFDSVKSNGIELVCHGDKASGGRPGSPNDSALVYSGNVTTGHTHSPQITPFGSYVVGTLTKLHLPYQDASAGNTWAHSNVIQYENGTRTNILIL